MLPFTRYNFVKVKPGKGADYRRTWEKYNKPIFDKLVADGVVLAFGLAAEEVKTDGEWTHFVWIATAPWQTPTRLVRHSLPIARGVQKKTVTK